MSDQQKPVTSIGENIDHSTKLETSAKPVNRNRTQHTSPSNNTGNTSKKAPSSNTNNNTKKPASKKQHPPVPNTHEKSSIPLTTRPPSTSRRQKSPGSNQNEAVKRTNARSGDQGSNRPATKTKSKQTSTGTRGDSTKRKASLKTDQSSPEIQGSIDENILVSDSGITDQIPSSLSTETLTETSPAESAPIDLLTTIEPALPLELSEPVQETVAQEIISPGQETLPTDLEEDDIQPGMKAVSIPPIIIEPEPFIPLTDLVDTPPRIKALITPQIEKELPVSSEAPPPIPRRFGPGHMPGNLVASILLILLISSSFLFWRDISDTHLYLYALDPANGHTLTQQDLGGGYQGDTTSTKDTTLLGADANFFYVASRATNALPPGVIPVVQLIAVDKTSGNIVWRIFGPGETLSAQTDYGNLLSGGRSIIWQVSNTIYSIDTLLGQIQWRKYIQENLSQVTTREETQMAEIAHVLLITRSDAFHALDLTNGNERWVTANSGDSTTLHLGGVVAGNNTLILYGKSMLQAIDPSDQHIIWRQTQLENIQSLKISANGTLAYAIVTNIQAGNPTNQGLVALDVKTGTIRWIFHPFDQERFVNAQSDGFQYSKNTLYVTLCSTA